MCRRVRRKARHAGAASGVWSPPRTGAPPASDDTCSSRNPFEAPSDPALAVVYQEYTRETEHSSRGLVPYRYNLPEKRSLGAVSAMRRDSLPRAHGKLADDDTHWQDYLDERNSSSSHAPREGPPRAWSPKRNVAVLRTSAVARNRTRLAELLGGRGGQDSASAWVVSTECKGHPTPHGAIQLDPHRRRERILVGAEVTSGGFTGRITELKGTSPREEELERSVIRI